MSIKTDYWTKLRDKFRGTYNLQSMIERQQRQSLLKNKKTTPAPISPQLSLSMKLTPLQKAKKQYNDRTKTNLPRLKLNFDDEELDENDNNNSVFEETIPLDNYDASKDDKSIGNVSSTSLSRKKMTNALLIPVASSSCLTLDKFLSNEGATGDVNLKNVEKKWDDTDGECKIDNDLVTRSVMKDACCIDIERMIVNDVVDDCNVNELMIVDRRVSGSNFSYCGSMASGNTVIIKQSATSQSNCDENKVPESNNERNDKSDNGIKCFYKSFKASITGAKDYTFQCLQWLSNWFIKVLKNGRKNIRKNYLLSSKKRDKDDDEATKLADRSEILRQIVDEVIKIRKSNEITTAEVKQLRSDNDRIIDELRAINQQLTQMVRSSRIVVSGTVAPPPPPPPPPSPRLYTPADRLIPRSVSRQDVKDRLVMPPPISLEMLRSVKLRKTGRRAPADGRFGGVNRKKSSPVKSTPTKRYSLRSVLKTTRSPITKDSTSMLMKLLGGSGKSLNESTYSNNANCRKSKSRSLRSGRIFSSSNDNARSASVSSINSDIDSSEGKFRRFEFDVEAVFNS